MPARPSRGGRGSRRRAGTACVLVAGLALVCATGPAEAAPERRYRGRPLVEVLRELQDGGLDLVFSTAVVRPEIRVTVEPAATEPRALLEEILAPLDLEARDGPAGSVLILPAEPKLGRLRGYVLSATHRKPIVGATVRVAGTGEGARTDEAGRFEIGPIAAGMYEVTVEAFGYTEKTLDGVRVVPGGGPRLKVELEDHPAFVTVVVTPSQHSLVTQEHAQSRTLTDEEIVLAPTIGGDVSRVVELLPGVAAPDNSAALNARGSVGRDVSYVLDGLELYDPFHLQGFQSPFSLIDANTVDRIDFFSGGFTADRGDRHGGFVEVSTLGPGEAAGGEIELGTLNSRVAYRSPFSGPPGSWLISARGWYPELLRDTIELARGEEDLDPRFGDFYVKAAFSLSPETLLSVHGLYVYDLLSFQERDEEVNESVDALTRNSYAWLRLLTSWSPGLTSETMISGGRIDRRRDGVSAPDEAVIVDDDRDVQFYGLKHDSTWEISEAHALKAGIDVRKLNAEYRYTAEVTADPAESASIRLDPDGTSSAVYVAHRARVSPSFTTELGVRWDRQTHTEDDQLSPRFNAVWRPGERTELRLALGRFAQSQRIHELHVEDGETGFSPAELADQAEVSFQRGFGNGLRLRLDAYYRKLSDLRPRYENLFEPIELFPETTEDRVRIAPSEAHLRGMEVLLRGDPERPLFWWVSYALSSAEDTVDGREVDRSWDQTHAGKFLVGYRRDQRWSVSLSGNAHSGWPTTPVTAEGEMLPDGTVEFEAVPGERNARRFPSYLRFDLQARCSFALPRGRLWLTLKVVNLTDRDNPCCVEDFFFEPRPDGTAGVNRQFDYWLGVTPSFSVLWEF